MDPCLGMDGPTIEPMVSLLFANGIGGKNWLQLENMGKNYKKLYLK